jgi:hypothetical protein
MLALSLSEASRLGSTSGFIIFQDRLQSQAEKSARPIAACAIEALFRRIDGK